MTDITLCTNKTCPSRDTCYRQKAMPSGMQSYADCYEPVQADVDYACAMYIDCRSLSQFKRLEAVTK